MDDKAKALTIAQDFNREVLKGQLNPNGSTVAELGRRIEEGLLTSRRFWAGFTYDEALRAKDAKIAELEKALKSK